MASSISITWTGSNDVIVYVFDGGDAGLENRLNFYSLEPNEAETIDVAPGEYLLEFQAVGYKGKPFAVSVKGGETTEITV